MITTCQNLIKHQKKFQNETDAFANWIHSTVCFQVNVLPEFFLTRDTKGKLFKAAFLTAWISEERRKSKAPSYKKWVMIKTLQRAFPNDKILLHRLMKTKYQFNMLTFEQIEFN